MSQASAYAFLKKNKGEWFTTKEVDEALGINSAAENLRGLYKYREVMRKQIKSQGGQYGYSWKVEDEN